MPRRPDPARIETARRSATIARLISGGRSASAAAGLVAEWEATLADGGRSPDRAEWERFDSWLTSREEAHRSRGHARGEHGSG